MKIGLASMSLFPLPLPLILRRASQAGFDFVEVFLFDVSYDRVCRLRERGEKLKLGIHFHQVWSVGEERDESLRVRLLNNVFTATGWLPKNGYRLTEHIPSNATPVVIYADRWREAVKKGMWLQTISVGDSNSLTRQFKCPWKEFREIAAKEKHSLVFDTMHFLEWTHDIPGIHLLGSSKLEILVEWGKFWCQFKDQVEEVHFNDFDPRLPEGQARNLFPGNGFAPLYDFAAVIKDSGWNKCMVPEVQPSALFPDWPCGVSNKRLLALRKKMDEYFG